MEYAGNSPQSGTTSKLNPNLFTRELSYVGKRVIACGAFGQSRRGVVKSVHYSRSSGNALLVLTDGGMFSLDEIDVVS